MDKTIRNLEIVLKSTGWTKVQLTSEAEKIGLTTMFEAVYAIAGICLAPTVKEVVECWADCQSYMQDFKNTDSEKSRKDLYLILIVPTISPDELSKIEQIINDTHICRKICIELRGRSLLEALSDCGLITIGVKDTGIDIPDIILKVAGKQLPREALHDLATRSPKTIFDKLLNNAYTLET